MAIDNIQYVNIPDSASSEELPFDGVINYHGSFVGFEAKRLTDIKAFHPSMIRDSQIRGLNASKLSGGTSVIGLFVWKPRTYNRMYFWEWDDFKKQTNNLTTSIKKNVYKDSEFCECKKRVFDLEKFYKFLDLHTTL